MNQHIGITYALSVAIVVAFAIALHRPDPPATKLPVVRDSAVAPVAGIEAKARTVSRVRVNAPRSPGVFTTVERGETLADVATRVYGTSGTAAHVWRANRDQLLTVETPPRAGMLLRTPSL